MSLIWIISYSKKVLDVKKFIINEKNQTHSQDCEKAEIHIKSGFSKKIKLIEGRINWIGL